MRHTPYSNRSARQYSPSPLHIEDSSPCPCVLWQEYLCLSLSTNQSSVYSARCTPPAYVCHPLKFLDPFPETFPVLSPAPIRQQTTLNARRGVGAINPAGVNHRGGTAREYFICKTYLTPCRIAGGFYL